MTDAQVLFSLAGIFIVALASPGPDFAWWYKILPGTGGRQASLSLSGWRWALLSTLPSAFPASAFWFTATQRSITWSRLPEALTFSGWGQVH